MKSLVRVKEGSFPVRYDGVTYKAGEEIEVLSDHAEHPSFEILAVIEPPKKRGEKTVTTSETEPTE